MPEVPLPIAIAETLAARDPRRQCILVGGAALHLQCIAAGIEPMPTGDVDALAPQEYFDELTLTGPRMPDILEFTFRRPSGMLKVMGATQPSITIKPDPSRAPNQLPFSASVAKGVPELGGHSFDELAATPDRLVTVDGFTCLNAGDIMITKAILGRRKDTHVVQRLVRKAFEAGLITHETRARIKQESRVSWAERRAHPHRYYARVDGS